MRAGGRATEAGMAFQAAVATWFAVHILARLPVGGRFGINNLALPVAIRLETGTGLDDIEVTQSDGGALHIQSKTSATLATGERAPLTKTGAQLAAGWMSEAKTSGGAPDPTRNAAVLAVRSDAARTLDGLEAACRAFDLGGDWTVTRAQRNVAQRTALDALGTIVTTAWTTLNGSPPMDADLTDMARSFHIARFSMDEGDADWREASKLLGRHLYGSDAAGDSPLRDLRGIMRDLIGNGAPADRDGLLRALRLRGHDDTVAPRYEADVARLRDATDMELARLGIHGQLPIGGGITITRESDAPLTAAMAAGSLLVVGEPGAGKTGALVHAANSLVASGAFVVFLSVDRFPGVAIAADLTSELRLEHDLVEVLAAVPGLQPRYLIIDALDAARGGPSEAVFATLIEKARAELAEDWTVIASIRTFDLRNGRRYRAAFAGAPADAAHSDTTLGTIRHFSIPRLADADLAAAGAASAEIAGLLSSASPDLAELLRNVFNLSLAAELLADGADPAGFSGIGTQSALIDTYEDLRMPTTGMTAALLALFATPARADSGPGRCTGHFVNPITDVCWSCLFPLSVGGLNIWPSVAGRPDTENPPLPVCACGLRLGISMGFWEPVRLADVSMKPWCFVNLGGMKLDPGFDIGFKTIAGPSAIGGKAQNTSGWHVHWYAYLIASVPFLAGGIARGAMAISSQATSYLNPSQNAAEEAAREASTGNLALGNSSFDNQTVQTRQHDQWNQAPSFTQGAAQTRAFNDTGTVTTNFAGNELLDVPVSRLPFTPQVTQSVAAEAARVATETRARGETLSNQAVQSTSNAVTRFQELRHAISNDQSIANSYGAEDRSNITSSFNHVDQASHMLQSRFGLRAEVADAIATESFVTGSANASAGVGGKLGPVTLGASAGAGAGRSRRWTTNDVAAVSRDGSRIQDALQSWATNHGWSQNRDAFDRSVSTSSRSDVTAKASGLSSSVTDAQSFSREARRYFEESNRLEARWSTRDSNGISGSLNTSDAFLAFARAEIANTPLMFGHFDPANAMHWQSSDPAVAQERSLLLTKYVEHVGADMRAEVATHLREPGSAGLSRPNPPGRQILRPASRQSTIATAASADPLEQEALQARSEQIRAEVSSAQASGAAMIARKRSLRDADTNTATAGPSIEGAERGHDWGRSVPRPRGRK